MALDEIGNPGSHRTLDRYILNYMRRRGLTTAAAIFAEESETTEESVEVDGLLKDWWAEFYGTYTTRPNFRPEEYTTSPEINYPSRNLSSNKMPPGLITSVLSREIASPLNELSLPERDEPRRFTYFLIGFMVVDLVIVLSHSSSN